MQELLGFFSTIHEADIANELSPESERRHL